MTCFWLHQDSSKFWRLISLGHSPDSYINHHSTNMIRFRLSSENSEGIHLQTQISHVIPSLHASLLITSRPIKVLKGDQYSGTNPWNLGRCRSHDNLPHTRACDYYYKFDHHRPLITVCQMSFHEEQVSMISTDDSTMSLNFAYFHGVRSWFIGLLAMSPLPLDFGYLGADNGAPPPPCPADDLFELPFIEFLKTMLLGSCCSWWSENPFIFCLSFFGAMVLESWSWSAKWLLFVLWLLWLR